MSETKIEKKIGFFLCSGCHIGDSVDPAKLTEIATKEFRLPVAKTHPFLCSDAGVSMIKDSIANEGVNAVSIAACSQRVMYETFDFGSDILLDRIDIREKGVWRIVKDELSEDTLALCSDYVRMGISKLKSISHAVPVIDTVSEITLVIGGGITGLTAAIDIADAGKKVILIEKDKELGGFMRGIPKTLPSSSPFDSLEDNKIENKIKAAKKHKNIDLRLETEIESTSGAPGMFDVKLKGKSTDTVKVGAIILAVGWKPYEKSKLTEYGIDIPDVITNYEFEELSKKGKILIPSTGKEPESVLFVQCAGSRDEKHLTYCSSVCCSVSLKQAALLREQNSKTKSIIVYKDMRTPAHAELFYKKIQQDPGIFLTKGEVSSISRDNGKISVNIKNSLLGAESLVKVDMVVLASGMISATYDENVLIDKPREEMSDREVLKMGKRSILNLTYRKGSELPHLSDEIKYPDSHFICFPYESQRTGIYVAGPAKHPADTMTSMIDAQGASLKAIQAINMVGQGKALHPRSGDETYPNFFLQRCTQCKRCTEECPFGTLDEDEKGTPKPNPTRCRRCGICMGACPERIIDFANYSVGMISSMVKSIDVPDEFSEKLRILALICENDAMPALDMAGINRVGYSADVRFIPLRCLGSTNLVWIADALSCGIDGVMMLGCKHGKDYQCHFIKGSELANTRLEKVKETLSRLRLEPERILVESIAISDFKRLPEIINNFAESLKAIPPNPYKGF